MLAKLLFLLLGMSSARAYTPTLTEDNYFSGCDVTTSAYVDSDLVFANLTVFPHPLTIIPHPSSFKEVDRSREFRCDFEHDNCGLINQANMGSYFQQLVTNFGGRNTTSLVLESERMQSLGGRLITPFFEIGRPHTICLSFDFFVKGPGAKKIVLYSQDLHTCVIARIDASIVTPTWKKQKISLFAMGDVRFFIEAQTNVGQSGTMAIDNIYFGHRPC